MQKKIVAAICAAALALAMPVAAFAESTFLQDAGETDSNVTGKIASVKSGNVTLKNIQVSAAKGYIGKVTVDGLGASAAAPSNAIAGSSAAFAVSAETTNGAAASFGTKYNKLTAQVEFAEGVTAPLNSTVAADNLYIAGTYDSNMNQTARIAAVPVNVSKASGVATISATNAGTITLEGLGTGTLNIWMQNGQYAVNDGAAAKAAAEEAKDGSKSPKTGELL